IWGADLDGIPVNEWRPKRPSMLVIGSEAHGLSEDVRGLLTGRVSIPPSGSVQAAESLNAAVAGGILMHAWSP
ncbi:MAG: RNA methyltransferase, partial [Rhodothermales bacterium]|nr:RNA methyltransferase [Rhodothermales bacterium]